MTVGAPLLPACAPPAAALMFMHILTISLKFMPCGCGLQVSGLVVSFFDLCCGAVWFGARVQCGVAHGALRDRWSGRHAGIRLASIILIR